MYFLILAILILLSFFSENKPKKEVLIAVSVLFILFIALRSPYIDNDYQNYLRAVKQGWGIAEISYFIIADISYALTNDTLLIFFIYAILGITTQFTAIYKHSCHFWLSLLFWFCTYFILLDMNAIRMGAALGLVMMSWEPWSKNEHAKALGFIALACVFHYSMIVLLPVYFCVRNNSKLILLFVALVPLAYVLHFSLKALSIFDMLNLTFVTIKSNAYKEAEINELPVFSTVLVMRMVVIALVFYFREALEKECSLFYLLFKLYCVGFFIVVTFADMPTVALRLLDIFACTELILLPMLCYRVEPRWPAILGVTGYAVFYFFLYFIKAEYLKPYELII